MSNLVSFDFQNKQVRTITDTRDNSPWFVLKDILQAMGSTTRPAIAKASIHEVFGKGVSNEYPLQTAGGMQNVTIINEPATTFLISRSNTETGKKLNRWIHAEVLPSIRKTGSYDITKNFNDPIEMAKLLQQQVGLYLEAVEELKEAKPKVEAFDTWLECDGDYCLSDAAKMLGTTSVTLNKFLRANGIKMKHYDLPTAKFKKWFNVVDEVYTDNKGNARKRMKCMITPEGLVEIKNRLP